MSNEPKAGDHLSAAILTIGDEIVTDHLVDTNASWLATELADRNVEIVTHVSLPDDQHSISRTLGALADSVDLIIATGGLGPTSDDLTRYALAEALSDEIVIDDDSLAVLKKRYADRGAEFPQRNVVQAQRPSKAVCIPNSRGTAPGLSARIGEAQAFFMPGIPREMKVMFNERVLPSIAPDLERIGSGVGAVRLLHTVSLAESEIGDRLSDLMERGRNPLVATLPSDSIVTIRVRATGPRDEANTIVDETAGEIEQRLAPYIFGRGNTTLADTIRKQLLARNSTVAVAESCTAGMLGMMLTEPAGASSVFVGGWQTYTNEMKIDLLGVDPDTIEIHGAVSGLCADQMAVGALERSGSDFALAITGIAGPDGGTEPKPVGTVFIALADLDEDSEATTMVRRFYFSGSREEIRIRASLAAMSMLHFFLKLDGELPPMLWQHERTDI